MGAGVAIFFTQQVMVETWLGTNSLGQEVFAPPVTVNGYAENKRQLVVNSDGEQVTSPTTVFTYLENLSLFTPMSRVTIDGTSSRVVSANANGGLVRLRLPDHLSVVLV